MEKLLLDMLCMTLAKITCKNSGGCINGVWVRDLVLFNDHKASSFHTI
jgi:hypothetical protein